MRGLTSGEQSIVASVMKRFCQRVDSAVNNPYRRDEASVKKRPRSRFVMWRAEAAFGLPGGSPSAPFRFPSGEYKFIPRSILRRTTSSCHGFAASRVLYERSVSCMARNEFGLCRHAGSGMTALTFGLIRAENRSIAEASEVSEVPRCDLQSEGHIRCVFSRIVYQGEVSRRGGIA